MSDISNIDKNFTVRTNIDKENIKFYNIDLPPFKVYGIFKENGQYRRMPQEVAVKVSEGVSALHTHTSGGRVRFVTDSDYVAISAEMSDIGKMPHFAFTGSAGFDMYVNNEYFKTFVPPCDISDGYESILEFENGKEKEITINFPLYSGVKNLYVGLSETATVKKAPEYKITTPFVCYGSSITQGGCASRPGSCYQSIISRAFDCDYINLGFSGSAKAEDEIIDYIKNLNMSLFIYDYDYNAPTVEHLKNTHEKMFNAIRKQNKDLPIIIMCRPKFYLTEQETERRKIIETTYKNAVSSGDNNVYYIDNEKLTALCKDEGTVDGCHPTDFGFASMAIALCDIIEKIKLL